MDEVRINELIKIYKEGLLEDTIPWWQNRFLDFEDGGYLIYRDADGTLLSTDKPVWFLGRIAWMWSRLYNKVEKRQDWLEVAKHGIDFMLKHAFDNDGRMFFTLTKDGRPLRKRLYLFSECFGAIALAEYARAAGSEEMLQKSKDLFDLIIKYHTTPGLLPPKVIPETRPMKSHGIYMILISVAQILREVDNAYIYTEVINDSIKEIFTNFVKPEKRCLLENVLADGSFLDIPEGRIVNPGHSIETAWFIMKEGEYRRDKSLVLKACEVLDWSLDMGWDEKYGGGILYYVDCDKKPPEPIEHELKLWWPHNEALYSTLLAYYLTKDEKWCNWYERIHKWTFEHFPDKTNGEWYGYLRRDGTISSPVKGNIWKGPFHLPRMQLNCWQLLESMKLENSKV